MPLVAIEPVERRVLLTGVVAYPGATVTFETHGLTGDMVGFQDFQGSGTYDPDIEGFEGSGSLSDDQGTPFSVNLVVTQESTGGYVALFGGVGFDMSEPAGGDDLPLDPEVIAATNDTGNGFTGDPSDITASVHITYGTVTVITTVNQNNHDNPGPDGCDCDGDTTKDAQPQQPAADNDDCGCGNTPDAPAVGADEADSDPVYYADGVVDQADSDLSSAAFGSEWGVTRDWTNNPQSTGTLANQEVPIEQQVPTTGQTDVFGNNVVENELPRLVAEHTTQVTFTPSSSYSGPPDGTTTDDSSSGDTSYVSVDGQSLGGSTSGGAIAPKGFPDEGDSSGTPTVTLTLTALGLATNGNNIYWFDKDPNGPRFYSETPGMTVSLSPGSSNGQTSDGTAGFSDGTTSHYTLIDDEPGAVTISQDDGTITTYYGFDPSIPASEQGQFESSVDANGVRVTAAYADLNGDGQRYLSTVTRSYTDSSTGITSQEVYAYSYGAPVNDGPVTSLERVTGIQLSRSNSASSAIDYVQNVQYAYYGFNGDAAGNYGNLGDLEYASTYDGQGPSDANAANRVPINTDYYRYYTSDSSSGFIGGLETVVTGAAYARLVASLGGTAVGQASQTRVDPFADYQYTYDIADRIASETVAGIGGTHGTGSSGTSGEGTITYTYTPGPGYDSEIADYNSWAVETTETMPDGNANVVFTNSHQQVMLEAYDQVQVAGHPSPADPTTATDYHYNDQGQVTQVAYPSAFQQDADGAWYDPTQSDPTQGSDGFSYLSSDSGLVETVTYASTTTAEPADTGDAAVVGDIAGYVTEIDDSQGTGGAAEPQESWQYVYAGYANVIDFGVAQDVVAVATDTTYGGTGGADPRTTSYAYTAFTDTNHIEEMDVTLPVISAGLNGSDTQNGSGVASVESFIYDWFGRVVWARNATGHLTYHAYDPSTGALIETIYDVDTLTGAADAGDYDATNLPTAWVAAATAGLGLVTTYTVDDQGRNTKEVDPDGDVTVWVYDDPDHEFREYDGWTGSSTTGPTIVYRDDWADGYNEMLTMSATPAVGTNGLPDGAEPIGDLQSLTRNLLDDAGQVIEADDYFDLVGITYSVTPRLGNGDNYYTTTYGYDVNGNQDQTTDAKGTIQQTVYNGQGEVVSTWVGTAEPAGWSPTNTAGGNLVDVQDDYYDDDTVPGGDAGGDGNLTEVVTHPGSGQANRVTTYAYDYQDEPVLEIEGAGSAQPIATVTTYDNAGEATETQQYAGAEFTTDADGTPTGADASLLRAQTVTAYDDLGRVYQQTVYSVDPTTGDVGTADTTNAYYDQRGLVLATESPTGLWTKYAYDGAGRELSTTQSQSLDTPYWASAGSLDDDVVLTATRYLYDADGNVIETVTQDREPTDSPTATGPLGPHAGSGGGDVAFTIDDAPARTSYADDYYDAAGRLTATVDLGTNGGTAWTRPSAVPARSADALVTSYTYDAAGAVATSTDPKGIVTAYTYDALGRTTQTVDDYTGTFAPDGTPIGAAPTSSTNQTTDYTYDGDGHVTSMTAVMPAGEASQTTFYNYGVSTAGGSGIDDNDLLHAVFYPDPTTGAASSLQAEYYAYDALGEQTAYTDRNGTAHTYTYDALGRLTSDAVSFAAGSTVDQTVKMLAYAYNDAGLLASATSYSSTAGGAANIVNQDVDTYDGFGQLTDEAQAATGPVVTSTPTVGYTYDAANGDRLTGIVYPDGRTVSDSYGASGSLTSAASQITSLSDASGPIQSYTYMGLDTPVTFTDGNGTELTYLSTNGSTGDAGDEVTGLDRFGRVVDQNWVNSSGTSVDENVYTYDADSNVLSDDNTVLPAQSEQYTYDPLNRLTQYTRGTLGSTSATPTETWSLDALGNWQSNTVGTNTTTRTNSAQNQVDTVTTPVSGGANTTATLGYDKDGNTLTDATGQQYAYDAWNRLVTVKSSSGTTTAAYTYDAQGRRVTEAESGTTTALYYSDQWQVLEERQAGAATTQYVWSPFDVDGLVERDTAAAPSDGLDAGFGSGGIVTQSAGGDPVVDTAVVDLPGGDVLVVANDELSDDVLLFRYTAAGAPDPTFGTGGELDTGISGLAVGAALSGTTLYVALVQELLVGQPTGAGLSVAAFSTATGAVDSSFGTAGVASTAFDYGVTTAAVAVDSSGRPVVAGIDGTAGAIDVARFTTAGVPDDTFGTDGEAEVTFGDDSPTTVSEIAIGPTGRISVDGSDGVESLLAVFTSAGVLDSTFADGGTVVGGQGLATITAMAFDPSGRLVVAGNLASGAVEVVRYDTDGSVDGTFDEDGLADVEPSGAAAFIPYALVVDASGRIEVVGNQGGSLAAVRLLSDGDVDTSFGTGGITVVGSVSVGPNGVLAEDAIYATPAGAGLALTAAGDLLTTGTASDEWDGAAVAFSLGTSGGTGLTQRLYAEQDADDNVTSLTDASGAVVERYAYDPYGAVTVENPDGTTRGDGTAASSSYGWVYLHQGLRLDVATGTYDDRNRVYIVSLGRFAQEDPEGYIDGLNTYQFVGSDPVDYIDPFGTNRFTDWLNSLEIGQSEDAPDNPNDPHEFDEVPSPQPNTSAPGASDSGTTCPLHGGTSTAYMIATWIAHGFDMTLAYGSADALFNTPNTVRGKAYVFDNQMTSKYEPITTPHGPVGKEGGPVSNAARHGFWIAELTRLYGPGVAAAIGSAHEAGQSGDPDSERDRANNEVAIQIGKKSKSECETKRLVEQYIRDGRFFDENLADPMHPIPFKPNGPLPKPDNP